MEDRVDYLESELIKYAESFAELSHHFSILHNFLVHQFGMKFKRFVQAEDAGENVDTLDSSAEADENNDELQHQAYQNDEDDEEMDEDNNEQVQQLNHSNVYQDDDDDGDEAQDEGLREVACPSQMVSVQFECEDEAAAESNNVQPSVNLARRKSLRNIASNPQGQVPRNVSQIKGPPTTAAQAYRTQTRSSLPQVGRVATRPPPPLIRRPPPSSLVNSNLNSHLKTVLATSESDSTTRGKSVDGGTGTGKYARYYKKVDSELIQCKICNKVLKRRGKFIQHLRTHTGEKPFQCDYCSASFSRRDNMNVHMTRHHSGSNPSRSYMISCQLCSSTFANQEGFNAHLQLVHGYVTEDDTEEGQEAFYDEDDDDDDEEDEPL